MKWTYDTRPDSDANTQGQLILQRHGDSRDVLGSVPDDRQEDEPDPFLADARPVRDTVDTVNKKFSCNRNQLQPKCEKGV